MTSKKLKILLSVCLLAFSLVPAAAAAEPVTVLADGHAVSYTDAKPFEKDGVWMVPVRATAEQMGLTVTYNGASKQIEISSDQLQAVFQSGDASFMLNGEETAFEQLVVTRQNRAYVPLSFFQAFGNQTAYNPTEHTLSIATAPTVEANLAHQIVGLLIDGEYEQLWNQFDAAMKEVVSIEALQTTWEQTAQLAGDYVGTTIEQSGTAEDGSVYIIGTVEFTAASYTLSAAVNPDGLITGLFLQPVAPKADAPADVVEEEVIVGEGSSYPLGGTLTLPANAEGPLPAVVLVQGSGPSDRDESVGAYKPFRDIAWGLAKQGIAVLRYDKRTYAHAAKLAELDLRQFTVKEEFVEDAILAAELLRSDARIDADRVFLIGHSQGGMLAPRIDTDGGNYAGIVILAGTPRTLWELIYDQNMNVLAEMDDQDPAKAANEAFVQAEYAKAQSLAAMSDEEALVSTVFGQPAYYFKEMDSYDAAALARSLDKPILILQGEDDFQVFADIDYVLWQEELEGQANVSFKLYPGLNHFFIDYAGDGENTLNEYGIPGTVSEEVIQDIGAWILKHE